MILCEVFIKPYLHMSLSVDSDHPVCDLELPDHLEAHTIASYGLTKHVQRGGERQLRQVSQPNNDPFHQNPQHLRVPTERSIVALAILHCVYRNKRIFLRPSILINLKLLL